MYMADRHIHHNFMIDNYSPQENVDNDDGSAYYQTHDNFMVYGGTGMKSDFGGHDNHHYGNIYAFSGCAVKDNTIQIDGHGDSFYENTVVMTSEDVGILRCDAPGKTVLYSNQYFTQSGEITECDMPLAEWQEKSPENDPKSTVAKWPTTEYILQLAREKLNF